MRKTQNVAIFDKNAIFLLKYSNFRKKLKNKIVFFLHFTYNMHISEQLEEYNHSASTLPLMIATPVVSVSTRVRVHALGLTQVCAVLSHISNFFNDVVRFALDH